MKWRKGIAGEERSDQIGRGGERGDGEEHPRAGIRDTRTIQRWPQSPAARSRGEEEVGGQPNEQRWRRPRRRGLGEETGALFPLLAGTRDARGWAERTHG
jgi:hypothetical protein